jgi:hypothetical protein
MKSNLQCNKSRPVGSFKFSCRPVLVETGQQVIRLHEVQVPMQNCSNLHYFVVHAAYGVKVYQV